MKTLKRIIFLNFLFIFFINLFIPAYAAKAEINFSKEEQDFISDNPVIRLGVDPKFVPFEFFNKDDEYLGIAADYLKLVSELTGLEFQVEKGLTWNEAYDKVLNKELDGLPAIGINPEREKIFIFSKPYYNFKRVVAIKDDNKKISGMDDLNGLTVAVQNNSSHHGYLLDFNHINISLYDDVESALVSVSTGEEVAYVGNLATVDYLIHANGITNLRLISFEAEKDQALHFATHKDKPQLISIFNKALNAITEDQEAKIKSKWINLDTEFDRAVIVQTIIKTVAISILVLLVSLLWIIQLRKEIDRRKKIQSQLELANLELEKISMVDGLTGISNRRYFDSFMDAIWDINKREDFPLSVIMIDIDHFKNFNDTFGHLNGDICLKVVANTIKETVGRPGDLVARFGGEEFIVLLSNTDCNGATLVAEKIRKAVEEEIIELEDALTSVTVSLGVSFIDEIGDQVPEDLIAKADEALYRAKNSGRNRVELSCD
ncbi:MAG: diguanylate cyclase [Tissierellaceae bacterium]|nr:diguanylate cyclase [Tissierellaceae bacterium]